MARDVLEAPTEEASILESADRPAGYGLVRVLTLNRPEKRNALNTALLRQLVGALRLADQDTSVRAVVLAGRGPSFCAGGDVSEFRDAPNPHAGMVVRAQLLGDVQIVLSRLSVPVVSAVQGSALGGGAVLALSADLTVVADDLSLGYPELQGGVVPAVVMASVSQLLGRKLAFELLTTSRRLTAEEARKHDLANRVVAGSKLLQTAVEVAAGWAALEPAALAETKRLFHRVAELSGEDAVQAGIQVTVATWKPRA